MIANDLQHLFNGTHCLSKRQLRDYAAGTISREEAYAVESHLNTCPLCSAAADGMLAHFPESAEVLAEVDAGFLKEHFKKHSPQIHLNTVAPAAAAAPVTRRIPGGRTIELTSLRTMGIAAGVLLLIASLWWMQNNSDDRTSQSLGEATPLAQAETPRASSSGIPGPQDRLARAGAAMDKDEAELAESTAEKRKAENSSAMAMMETAGAAALEADAAFAQPVAPSATAAAPAGAPVEEARLDKAALADESSSRTLGDVAVRSRSYRRPLIEPKPASPRAQAADKEIEKMPARSTTDIASTASGSGAYQKRKDGDLSIGGGRAENTTVVVDGVAATDGKALYKKGSYIEALKVFRSQISTSSGAAREESMLYAARCHRMLGQSTSAKKLLQELASGTGARARAARRELRSMGVATPDDTADKSR